MGLVINAVTHAANIHGSVGAKQVFEKIVASIYDEPNLQHIFADASYRSNLKNGSEKLDMSLTIVKRTYKKKIGKYNLNDGLFNEYLLGYSILEDLLSTMKELKNLPLITSM